MLARIGMMRALNHGKSQPEMQPRRKQAKRYRVVDGRLIFNCSEGRTKAEEGEEKAVIGALSRRTERLIAWYIRHHFGDVELHPDTILFVTGGHEPISRLGEAGNEAAIGRRRLRRAPNGT